jgi:hypothetical protein
MASGLIMVLAASGLVASGAPAVTATRSAQAMPSNQVALVKAAPAKTAGAACFLPAKNGKVASLSDFTKAKAAGSCADTGLAGGSSGGGAAITHDAKIFSTFVAPAAGIGLAAVTIVCVNGNSQTKC